jgi:hypothetical protein
MKNVFRVLSILMLLLISSQANASQVATPEELKALSNGEKSMQAFNEKAYKLVNNLSVPGPNLAQLRIKALNICSGYIIAEKPPRIDKDRLKKCFGNLVLAASGYNSSAPSQELKILLSQANQVTKKINEETQGNLDAQRQQILDQARAAKGSGASSTTTISDAEAEALARTNPGGFSKNMGRRPVPSSNPPATNALGTNKQATSSPTKKG